jgi:hypothetical protein
VVFLIERKLADIAFHIALDESKLIYISSFEKAFPEIVEAGLTDQGWRDLELITRKSSKCREVVIQNAEKINILEAFFRLRVSNWNEREKRLFLEPLKRSAWLSYKTAISVEKLRFKNARKWDETLERQEFEEIKGLILETCFQQNLLKKTTKLKYLVIFVMILLVSYLIFRGSPLVGIEREDAFFIATVFTALCALISACIAVERRRR